MSPVKISAIKTHVPAISRIAASTANLNRYIGRKSRRSVSGGFSDATDDDDQVAAEAPWEEGEEDQTDDQQQSDEETPASNRTEPTDVDSESDNGGEEEQPAPPKSVKSKTVKSVKGDKQPKSAEKAPKKPASTKKQAKSDDDGEEKPTVKAKTPKKSTSTAPTVKSAKKPKDETQSEKKQPAKPTAKKPTVKATISEKTASIGFEKDEDDAKVMEKSKQSENSTEKSNKRTKPKVEDKDTSIDSKKPRVRRPQLPNIEPSAKKSKAKQKPALTAAIDKEVFTEYRNLIAPFISDISAGTKDQPETITIADRYATMDAFYGAARQLATKMQKEAGESYSKHCIQVKKDKERTSVLMYIDGETAVDIKSNIEGTDALKFFRMNPIKKELDDDAVMEYLKGSFIDTVNILSINVKQLSLLDYDRLTQFSFYNDVEYAKEPTIKFDLPKYVDLIKNLPRWTMAKVFDARCNFLALITEDDREKLWADAVKRFDEHLEQEFEGERVVAILEIFNKLMRSEYFKQYLMFGATPNTLFAKIFKNFLETPLNKDILIELFTGPLESIGFMFTPYYFKYRGVKYGNESGKPTFDDLVKITDDPDMYDPRTAIWIAKLV